MPDPENYDSTENDVNDFNPNIDSNVPEASSDVNNQTNEVIDSTPEGLKNLTEIQKQNLEIMAKLNELFPHAFMEGSDDLGNPFFITKNYGEDEEHFGKMKIIYKYGIATVANPRSLNSYIRGDKKIQKVDATLVVQNIFGEGKYTPVIYGEADNLSSGNGGLNEKIENFVDADIAALKDQFSAIEAIHINDEPQEKLIANADKKPKTAEDVINLFK